MEKPRRSTPAATDAVDQHGGDETLQYRYTSGKLTGITAIDGAVTTITYSGSTSVVIQTVNSRTTTLTLALSADMTHYDLTKIVTTAGR